MAQYRWSVGVKLQVGNTIRSSFSLTTTKPNMWCSSGGISARITGPVKPNLIRVDLLVAEGKKMQQLTEAPTGGISLDQM